MPKICSTNFEAFCCTISSSIKHLFLKSVLLLGYFNLMFLFMCSYLILGLSGWSRSANFRWFPMDPNASTRGHYCGKYWRFTAILVRRPISRNPSSCNCGPTNVQSISVLNGHLYSPKPSHCHQTTKFKVSQKIFQKVQLFNIIKSNQKNPNYRPWSSSMPIKSDRHLYDCMLFKKQ